MSSSEREARVERDQIHALFGQVAADTLAVSAAAAVLVVLAMWNSVARPVLLTWLALYVADLLLRLVMARAFKRENPAGTRLRLWARRYTIGMAFSGAIFGSLAWFMFPYASPLGQVFLIVAVKSMAAASITQNGRSKNPDHAASAPVGPRIREPNTAVRLTMFGPGRNWQSA